MLVVGVSGVGAYENANFPLLVVVLAERRGTVDPDSCRSEDRPAAPTRRTRCVVDIVVSLMLRC